MFDNIGTSAGSTESSNSTELEQPHNAENDATDTPQAASRDDRPGIRVMNILPEEDDTPEVRVTETGFGWFHLVVALLGGVALGSALVLLGPAVLPLGVSAGGLEVIA